MYKEKLEEAASNYRQEFVDSNIRFEDIDYAEENYEAGRLEGVSISAEEAFIAGANWALENQWHDASKELPEDGIKVIVLTGKGNAAINSVYTFNGNRRWHSNYAVLFWMPIPSLPKELK